MNKIANYKDMIYKEAGVVGGALTGAIGGALAGTALGNVGANVRNNLTTDKERKELHKARKQSKKDLRNTKTDFYNYENDIQNGLKEDFNSYMSSLTPKERNEVTRGQIESRLSAKAKSITKQASTSKAMLATSIPVGISAAIGTYKTNTNKKNMKQAVKENKSKSSNLKDMMSGKKKYNANTSIANVMNLDSSGVVDGENIRYYMGEIDSELKNNGIKPQNVKYKEYKNIFNDTMKNYENPEYANAEKEAVKKYLNKVANYKEAILKEASWSKDDKKGYAKNVAIGVIQDFLNAGNPLNIGSSVIGSIADSALLERSSLNLNKQLKDEEVQRNKVDNFNKAVELKNGTAIPQAAINKLTKKR